MHPSAPEPHHPPEQPPADQDTLEQRLSRITTLWTLVREAHGGAAGAAQEALLERYGGAVYRYLLGALRDRDAADELFQEFSLRFLRGDFKNADPRRGRFRDFVKTSLFHLVVDHQRRRPAVSLDTLAHVPAVEPPSQSDSERQFLESWRLELLDRTWLALAELERRTGQPSYTVLRFRADHPLLSSEQMAERLSSRLGKSYSVTAVRQALHRAREKFADLLLQEVVQSLEGPSPEQLEEELNDLGLLSYCRTALERRGRR